MARALDIRRLHSLDDQMVAGLADVLVDCVAGGASVGFMAPLTRARAESFWQRIAMDVAAGGRALLVAEDADGICGTVQLALDLPDNQPHRADLCKMLVHRRARRRGLGAALMTAAEDLARECGRSLLVLDAVTDGDAARLYTRLGWTRVGDVPGFALYPDGRECGTTYFWKRVCASRRAHVSSPCHHFSVLRRVVPHSTRFIESVKCLPPSHPRSCCSPPHPCPPPPPPPPRPPSFSLSPPPPEPTSW